MVPESGYVDSGWGFGSGVRGLDRTPRAGGLRENRSLNPADTGFLCPEGSGGCLQSVFRRHEPRGVGYKSLFLLVGRVGFEPTTNGLKVHCSTS